MLKLEPALSLEFREPTFGIFVSCNLKAVDVEEQAQRAVSYMLFVSAIAITQFLVIIKIMRSVMESQPNNQRYSMGTLIWIFCWDGFVALLHLEG